MNCPLPNLSLETWLHSNGRTLDNWPEISHPVSLSPSMKTNSLGILPFRNSEILLKNLIDYAQLDTKIYSEIENRTIKLLVNTNKLVNDMYDLPRNSTESVDDIPNIELEEITNNNNSGSCSTNNNSDSEMSDYEINLKPIERKDKTLALRIINENRRSRHTGHTKGARYNTDKSLKKAENAIFMGYDFEDLTPMPGQIEPLRILDYISRMQAFPSNYMKQWKKLFYSRFSNIILHDFFWWVWLDKFCPEPETQVKYFTRIAESYTSLFLSISNKFRDSFFKNYSTCLCQALYLSFWILFPGSREDFNDSFKDYLTRLIYNCILGVEPSSDTLLIWNFRPEEFNKNYFGKITNKDTISQFTKSKRNEMITGENSRFLPAVFNSKFTKFNTQGNSPLIAAHKSAHMSECSQRKRYINRLELSLSCEVPSSSSKLI